MTWEFQPEQRRYITVCDHDDCTQARTGNWQAWQTVYSTAHGTYMHYCPLHWQDPDA